MTEKRIHVGDVAFALEDYAIVGNAILGIKGAGKTFLAKSIAEQLLDFNVQPVIFDPIGVWRHLRRPAPGRNGKGFRVVVAGGQEPDLPLTVQSAPEVVRAAIRENVPLVIDLYDRHLSKGDWRKIVRACCRVLFYENTAVTRHIIVEEAAEFVPQRIDDGETYAELEKIVRMGGNVALGITLVNQRSQEVNKAVLELCENLFLMRQRGAKAIEALGKWVGMLNPDTAERIKQGLPDMETGYAWVFAGAGSEPKLARCAPIRSFHPDRKRPELLAQAGAPADLGDFVSRMSGELATLIEAAKADDPKHLRARIRDLERQLAGSGSPDPTALADALRDYDQLEARGRALEQNGQALERLVRQLGTERAKQGTTLRGIVVEIAERLHALELLGMSLEAAVDVPQAPAVVTPITRARRAAPKAAQARTEPAPAQNVNGGDLTGPERKLLASLAFWDVVGIKEPTHPMVAYLCGYAPVSGGFTEPRATLKAKGLVEYVGKATRLTPAGARLAEYPTSPGELDDFHTAVLDKLPNVERKMLTELLNAYPKALDHDTLAGALGYAKVSGGFTEPRGVLKRLGIIEYPERGMTRAAGWLFPDGLS